MDIRRLLADMQRRAHFIEPYEGMGTLRAFLQTLAERLVSRDALILADDLPEELASFLLSPPRAHGEVFAIDELYRRMHQRHPSPETERLARLAGGMLAPYFSERAWQVLARLPQAFVLLFSPLPPAPSDTSDEEAALS